MIPQLLFDASDTLMDTIRDIFSQNRVCIVMLKRFHWLFKQIFVVFMLLTFPTSPNYGKVMHAHSGSVRWVVAVSHTEILTLRVVLPKAQMIMSGVPT